MNYILLFISALSTLTCLGLAGFALSRRPRSLVNQSFAAGLAGFGLIQVAYTLALGATTTATALFWARAAIAAEGLTLVAWVLFSVTFSRGNRLTSTKVLVPMAASAIGLAGFLWFLPTDPFLKTISDIELTAGTIPLGRVGHSFYIFFLLGLVYCAANLEVTLRSSTGTDRWRMKFLILGIEGLLAYTIFQTSQWLIFHEIRLSFTWLRASVLLVSSGFMAFGIVRHQLLDTRVRVSRHVIYQSLTLLLVGVYLLLVSFLAGAFQYWGVSPQYFVTVLVLFLGAMGLGTFLLSEKLRSRARRYISTHFYRNKYDYRVEWLRVAEELTSKITLEELITPIIDLFASTVEVSRISLWIRDPGRRCFALHGGRNVLLDIEPLAEDNSLVILMHNSGNPVPVESPSNNEQLEKVNQENAELCQRLGAVVWVPLRAGEELFGLVSLGPMISGDRYTEEDYDLLKTMGRQAGSVILNALLSRAMLERKEMETFHKLSSFVLHDMKNFVSSLSMVVQNAAIHQEDPAFQREAFKTVERTVRNMSGLITKLSSDRQGLELHREQTDLNRLAEEALAELQVNGSEDLRLTADLEPVPSVAVDRTQIQKVIRNLLLNAVEAMGGKGYLSIRTWAEDGWVNLAVSDTGPGMERDFIETRLFRPFQTTKGKGLGLGLYHCKAIMEAHDGQIEVTSEVAERTTFTLRFVR